MEPPDTGAPAGRKLRAADLALLLGCSAWVLAWGVWAVLLDNRPSGNDALFPFALRLAHHIAVGDWHLLGMWLGSMDYHPPLPAAHAALVGLAAGGVTLDTTRIAGLLLHVPVIALSWALARRLGGGRAAAAIAAILCALVPSLAGWFRMDFPEPAVAVFVLATLLQAARTDLRRPAPAVLLGLLVGLGSLTKLSYPLIMLPAAAVFLAERLRARRTEWLNAALATAATLVVAGWWYLPSLGLIAINFGMSTQQPRTVTDRADIYFRESPDHLLLVVAATAGAALFALLRRRAARPALPLLAAWAGGYLAFLLLFDPQRRYVVPLMPLGCVLCGLGASALMAPSFHRGKRFAADRLWAPRVAVGCLLAAMAAMWVSWSGQDGQDGELLHPRRGLFAPDRRQQMGYCAAHRFALRSGPGLPLLLTYTDEETLGWFHDRVLACVVTHRLDPPLNYDGLDWEPAYRRAGGAMLLEAFPARQKTPQQRPLPVLGIDALRARLAKDNLSVIKRIDDDSPFSVMVYRVTPNRTVAPCAPPVVDTNP